MHPLAFSPRESNVVAFLEGFQIDQRERLPPNGEVFRRFQTVSVGHAPHQYNLAYNKGKGKAGRLREDGAPPGHLLGGPAFDVAAIELNHAPVRFQFPGDDP